MKSKRKILVIDVGGTHIKLLATGQKEKTEFASGPTYRASDMVRQVKKVVQDWDYDVISMGYPGPVVHGHPLREPHNLGGGWVHFDFKKAFGHEVKIINDAAMQAIGSYRKGRMLYLGLGTGLGSAMIANGRLEPMELGHLPYRKGKTYEDYVGVRGLERLGKKKWQHHVIEVVNELCAALCADEVVLGGGNSKKLTKLPPHTRLGSNQNAFIGGFRMWDQKANTATWS